MTSVLFDHPGPKARARHRIIAAVSALLVVLALWWALAQFKEKGNLDAAKWTPFLTADIWVNYLLPGLQNTLIAAALSIVFAGAFGLVFGMGRLSHVPAIRWVSTVVVEFFRSVPVLVMMFFAFNLYRACLMLFQPVDAAYQRRLARTRWAANNNAFASFNRKVYVAQHMKLAVPLVDTRQYDCRATPAVQI